MVGIWQEGMWWAYGRKAYGGIQYGTGVHFKTGVQFRTGVTKGLKKKKVITKTAIQARSQKQDFAPQT